VNKMFILGAKQVLTFPNRLWFLLKEKMNRWKKL
jgi:hypothetical protein